MIVWLVLILILAVALLVAIGIGLVRGVNELVRRTPPPLALPQAAAERAIELLAIKVSDVVVDLGCGDGRLLEVACQAQPKAHFVGVDHDPTVLLCAWWCLKPWRSQLKLQRQNLFKTDLSVATKVICYLSEAMMARLEPYFDEQLRPGKVRLVSADYPLPNRRPTKIVWVNKKARRGRVLYLYDY